LVEYTYKVLVSATYAQKYYETNNMTDLRQKLAFDNFQTFKSLISCLVFIHSRESIEVFDKATLQKYLA